MQLQHSIDGGRPLDADLVADLDAFLDRVADAPAGTVPVLHLSGAPAGPPAQRPAIGLVNKWERVLRRLERLPAPTVAAVAGDCGGTAVEALLATDHRIAAAGSRLHLPAGAGGVWPGMGLYRLVNQAGYARVRRSVLFGAPIPAARAAELDLVDEVAAAPAAAVAAAVRELSGAGGAEVAVRRQLMLDATTTTFEEALGRHLAACDRLLRRAAGEGVPGVAAFA
ncbi:hypothetical protein GCM10010123_22910 [Pilimelia anulata]|uniref:Uncharacterized protein n=1 Tax=Pilimelia anulata TaxID=53371 RepID=A0A8J3FAI6_9ACTN|nr:enoyl-CoA-hydratase DpgB [Pilimelia anulata]GGJ92463.1 hypothetical protein GCM10010123_22910 [Pilimelia anulata]